ncbi:MAG: WYL domain-containing protein, partial [Thermoleophilia bacterium]|nr:WYL domain-containing protein [Thermoleophilia bacterium]
LSSVADAHEGDPPVPAPEVARTDARPPLERVAGPIAPERFAVLQALLAYLLARCGDEPRVDVPAAELRDRFHLDDEQLAQHLSLLNLVNFGGGCYALYATLVDDHVHVEKELFGDTFRRPPRLTPLEARAIRLALEFVGPMIAAEAHTPLDRVRRKLEETFGQFELPDGVEPEAGSENEGTVRTLTEAIAAKRLVEIEYLAVGEEATVRLFEPHALERELPYWYLHGWDRSKDAQRSFRLDRMRRVTLLEETFEPRPGLEPAKLRDARTAQVLFSAEEAPRRVERGARPLADGTALEDMRVGSDEWLAGEILSHRGHAVVLSPGELRALVRDRARELQRALAPA